MSEVIAAIIGAFLGWFFGFAATPIVELWNRRRTARELAGPLSSELNDLRDRCAQLHFYLLDKYAPAQRVDLQWSTDTIAAVGLDRSNTVLHSLRAMLEASDEQLAAAHRLSGDRGSTALRKLQVPFLDAQIHRLGLFSVGTQEALMKVCADLRIYNETVDEYWRYFDLTFQVGISRENHDAVEDNMRRLEPHIARRCRFIAEAAATAVRGLSL